LSSVAHNELTRQAPRPWWHDLLAPVAVALVLRLLLLVMVPAGPSWDGVIYVRAAEQLARGEGYTLRILHEGNRALPTAFYPVGFPAVLAVLRMLGGSLLADRLLQIFASTALVPIAALLARRVSGRRAGRFAAWAAALWPGGVFMSATWLAEPMFALGVGLAVLPLVYTHRRRRLYALLFAALLLGLTAYLRASSLPMAALLGASLGFAWLRHQSVPRRLLAGVLLGGLVTGLACLPLAPWTLRNARLLGEPVLVSTNGGVNLLLGTRGDGGYAPIGPNEECKTEPLREIQRDHCYRRRAIEVIKSAPLDWAARGLLKLVHTYGHESAPAQCFAEGLLVTGGTRETWKLWALALCRLGWLLLLSGALAGAALVVKRATPICQAVLLAPVVALGALHTVYLGGDRYHPAVAPMVLALVGIALAAYLSPRARTRASTRRKPAHAATRASDTHAPDRLDPTTTP
jgi:hypothetical protein